MEVTPPPVMECYQSENVGNGTEEFKVISTEDNKTQKSKNSQPVIHGHIVKVQSVPTKLLPWHWVKTSKVTMKYYF